MPLRSVAYSGAHRPHARIRLHRARTRLKLAMAEAASTQKHAAVSRHERVTDVESNGTPQEVFDP